MGHSKIKTMTAPTGSDWTVISIIWGITVTLITVSYKWINSYFAYKKQEKSEFIERVVTATVTATLDKVLEGVRSDIKTLFKFREVDRQNLDNKFVDLMREIKK